jgi:2,4-dienoyl-CoA reductase (NADPH2)
MIIGGGPAGMEAARVAASRGHHVTLLERQNKLGGLLPLAVMVKGTDTEDILSYLEYLRSQLDTLGVDVQLGRTAAPTDIAAAKPDVVIVATGGKYQMPEMPGISRSIVTGAGDLARKAKHPLRFVGPRLARAATKLYLPFGKHVIVIGASIEGVETAEFLIKRGRAVTIVDTADSFGLGMPERLLMRLRVWLQERQTPIHLGVRMEKITDDGLHLVASDGRRSFIEADDIVVALPQVPDTTLVDAVATAAPEVHYAGPPPSGEPWLIVDAVAAGFRVAKSV